MKQKEIVINGKLSIDAEEMINDYFKTHLVNNIETFVLSDKEFLDKYEGTYCFKELNPTKQYAIYTIECIMCFKAHDTIINSRESFYRYVGADFRLCSKCFNTQIKLYNSGIGLHLSGIVVT